MALVGQAAALRNQILVDPEIPDTWLSILMPAMVQRGVQPQEIAQFTVLSGAAMQALDSNAGVMEGLNPENMETESLINNLTDIVGGFLGQGTNPLEEIGDTIDDFFSSFAIFG
jgi:hypothetical protein